MIGYINKINFSELNVMKYWAPPASWSDDKKKAEVRKRIFSGEWYGAQKRDGALYVFLKDEDGNITLRGRSKSVSGEYIDKWNHLPHLHEWGTNLPNGTCFLGEVYWPGNEGSHNTTSIMNCLTEKAISRQTKDENKLKYYIFDIMAYDGENYLSKPALTRFTKITEIPTNPYIELAYYWNGQDLWDNLQRLLSEGYEGIVITHKDALYEQGGRPSKTTMKVKQELKQTIDCFFTGRAAAPTQSYTGIEIESWPYWYNEITKERLPEGPHWFEQFQDHAPIIPVTKPWYYHWAGSLEIGLVKNGEVIGIGFLSGLTDEIKANYKDYAYRVIEVGAMMLTKDKALRHGKMLGFRDDKEWTQCDYSQLDQ